MDQQIQSGCAARAGQHVVTVHIEHVRIDLDLWKPALQQFGVLPVGGRLPAVQQSGLRKAIEMPLTAAPLSAVMTVPAAGIACGC
ncbi:hypothetical protein GCM10023075_05270 [Streptosporangium album]